MLPADPWQPIQEELSALLQNNAYSSLRPLLERFKPVVDAKRSNPNYVNLEPEQATTFLNVVKKIQAETEQGSNLLELVQQVAYNQSDLSVQGNLNQAGRDLTIQIFNSALPNFQQNEPDPRIAVPIVLLVMNASEANELASGVCFQGYPDDVRTDFNKLQALLIENNSADWQQRYRETAKEWRPFKDSQESIEWLLGVTVRKAVKLG